MIFVITGSHTAGFDRMVRLADRAAEAVELEGVAQIGASRYMPTHLSWFRFCSGAEYYARLDTASQVITHGGYTVVEALIRRKRVVAIPRRKDEGEALDDHQVDFVNWLASRNLIDRAETVETLAEVLTKSQARPSTPGDISATRGELQGFLRESIETLVRVESKQGVHG